jgi:hypothetical protein
MGYIYMWKSKIKYNFDLVKDESWGPYVKGACSRMPHCLSWGTQKANRQPGNLLPSPMLLLCLQFWQGKSLFCNWISPESVLVRWHPWKVKEHYKRAENNDQENILFKVLAALRRLWLRLLKLYGVFFFFCTKQSLSLIDIL